MARKYGRPHARRRARWAPDVALGGVRCARCGLPIVPGEPWDLGHDDLGDGPVHPEHRKCNRGTAGRGRAEIAAARAAAVAEPVPEGAAATWSAQPTWSRHWFGGFDERCPDCRARGEACDAAKA